MINAWTWIEPKHPSVLTRWVFLRLLGVVYLIAFASAAHQVQGLIGSHGILPVATFLKLIGDHYGAQGPLLVPSVLWLNSSDSAIRVVCESGIGLSVLLIAGVTPVVTTALLWMLYLSLTTTGQIFFGYQWDALLLETGLLAVLYSPLQWMLGRHSRVPPSTIIVPLLRLLLFRLMLSSGIGKLTTGDVTWLHFTALRFHYFTQPLPPWTAWYFQKLPNWFQAVSVGFTFFAEIIAPLMFFGSRRARLAAFWTLVVLQLLIITTGNFGFFNLLAITLCFSLIDDGDWPHRLRQGFVARGDVAPTWIRRLRALVAAVIVVLGGMRLIDGSFRPIDWPPPMSWIDSVTRPLESFNSYGLFREMTTTRTEIIVEGSDDGITWTPFEFKWKPGDPMRRPGFTWFDMPRLDWQMWFAALGDLRGNLWFLNFTKCLLNDSSAVEGLLADDPFRVPPKYVRARTFDYRFTTAAERSATGAWWWRQENGVYLPGVSVEELP